MFSNLRVPRVPDSFELLIAYLCLMAGPPLAFGAPPPNSIQQLLPGWVISCWGGVLFLGGLLIILGVSLRQRNPRMIRYLMALKIETAGLMLLAAGSLVFGIAIISLGEWRAAFAAGTYLAFAAACLFRTLEVKDAERGLITVNRINNSKPPPD